MFSFKCFSLLTKGRDTYGETVYMDTDEAIINQPGWCGWGAPWRYLVDERFVQIWETVKEFNTFQDGILQSDKWYFHLRTGFVRDQRHECRYRKEVRWFVLRYKWPYIHLALKMHHSLPQGHHMLGSPDHVLLMCSAMWSPSQWCPGGTHFLIRTCNPDGVPLCMESYQNGWSDSECGVLTRWPAGQ